MSLEEKVFGRLPDGRPVPCFTLKNTNGMSAEFLAYGCRIVSLCVPDRSGRPGNVVIGQDTLEEYLQPGNVFGSAVGRFANRIGGAEFSVGGKAYHLFPNDHGNSLHSAPGGFQDRLWRLKRSSADDDAPSVTFAYRSPDGECGFPGNADAEITYTLSTDNALIIEYSAKTDAETPINLTNHTYFNLTGDPSKEILSQELQINADYITETDDGLIPTGRLLPVAGTAYDFRKAKTIGQDIRSGEKAIQARGGYDDNFVLGASEGVRRCAELYDQASGRRMLVFTDLPGVQLYTANSYRGELKASGGIPLRRHNAVCLETQYYPDSVNHPEFPFRFTSPEKPYRSTTIYKFITD